MPEANEKVSPLQCTTIPSAAAFKLALLVLAGLLVWLPCFPGFSAKNVDLVEMDAWCRVARKAAFDAFYACDRFGETISFLVGGAQH